MCYIESPIRLKMIVLVHYLLFLIAFVGFICIETKRHEIRFRRELEKHGFSYKTALTLTLSLPFLNCSVFTHAHQKFPYTLEEIDGYSTFLYVELFYQYFEVPW